MFTLGLAVLTLLVAIGPARTQGMRLRPLSPAEKVTRALHAPAFYLRLAFVPSGLNAIYEVPDSMLPSDAQFTLPCLVTVGLTAAALPALLLGRGGRGEAVMGGGTTTKSERAWFEESRAVTLSLAWATYVSLLMPSLGLLTDHIWGLAADRYCYIANLVVGVPLLAAGLDELAQLVLAMEGSANNNSNSNNNPNNNNSNSNNKDGKIKLGRKCTSPAAGTGSTLTSKPNPHTSATSFKVLAALAGPIFLVAATLAATSRAQAESWRNSEALWERAVAIAPSSSLALNNLASTRKLGAINEPGGPLRGGGERGGGGGGGGSLNDSQRRKREWEDQQKLARSGASTVDLYARAVAQAPAYVSGIENLAVSLGDIGRSAEALDWINRAVALSPTNGRTYEVLGAELSRSERNGSGLGSGRSSSNGGELQGGGVRVGGDVHREAEAAAAFEKALLFNPTLHLSAYNIATIFLRRGQSERALEMFEVAATVAPTHAVYLNNFANALQAAGRGQEARATYEAALFVLRSARKADMTGNNLAADPVRAIELLPEIRANLAGLLGQQGRLEEAADHYRGALEARPNYPEATCGLGSAYGAMPGEEAGGEGKQGGEGGYELHKEAVRLWIKCTELAPAYAPTFAPNIFAFCSALAQVGEDELWGPLGEREREIDFSACAKKWGKLL